MNIAGKFATAALTASTLASTVRGEDIYVTLYPKSDLQRQAEETLIRFRPNYAVPENELRPDMRPMIGLDLAFREQMYFNECMVGRSWYDGTSTPIVTEDGEIRFIFDTLSQSRTGVYNAGTQTSELSPVPSRGALTLLGLAGLVAARRKMRRHNTI
jgi:MYXO-CTERM domain-containing protein